MSDIRVSRRRLPRALLLASVLAVLGLLAASGLGLLNAYRAPAASGVETSSSGAPIPVANISVGSDAAAQPIATGFWGADVLATAPYNVTDALRLSETPLTTLRYPGGSLGERYNYSSNLIYFSSGRSVAANTSIADFISICDAIHCRAILQLPSEINNTTTVSYLVRYIVDTLGFQPAYWEIGDSPSGWTHLGIPWTQWNNSQATNITPLPFAYLVHSYVDAVSAVDPGAQFLALGTGLFPPQFAKAWVTDLAEIDGPLLSGITLHNYADNASAPSPTLRSFFDGLYGNTSLRQQVTHVRADILAACPTCTNLPVFVDEANAAQIAPYEPYLSTFNGSLFLAADAIEGLKLHLVNLDWFCFDCNYSGAFETSPATVQSQFYLFADILDHLENTTLPTNVTGARHVYAIATANASGTALLVVNTNVSGSVKLNLSAAGFCTGTRITESYWSRLTPQPVERSIAPVAEPILRHLSLGLFVQPACTAHPLDPSTIGASVFASGSGASVAAARAPIAALPGSRSG